MLKRLSFIVATLFTLTSFSQTKNFLDQPYIEVAGTADTLVTPNKISIKIILSEKDTRDRVPIEEMEFKMVAGLKSIGINTEEKLTISDMLSNYKTYLLKQKDILKTKEYQLVVSDAATLSKVFLQLENMGISNTSIEKVEHTELEGLKNACRTKAIENAKQKALALVKPLSQKVGYALFISDNEGGMPNPYQDRMYGMQVKTMAAESYEPPKIEFKKIQVAAGVNVRFVLQ